MEARPFPPPAVASWAAGRTGAAWSGRHRDVPPCRPVARAATWRAAAGTGALRPRWTCSSTSPVRSWRDGRPPPVWLSPYGRGTAPGPRSSRTAGNRNWTSPGWTCTARCLSLRVLEIEICERERWYSNWTLTLYKMGKFYYLLIPWVFPFNYSCNFI